MANIKPVSDLRNYNEILKDVQEGSPVFLTKNGHGQFVVSDIHEYEKMQASIKLLTELANGEKSARENGWLSMEDVEQSLGIR